MVSASGSPHGAREGAQPNTGLEGVGIHALALRRLGHVCSPVPGGSGTRRRDGHSPHRRAGPRRRSLVGGPGARPADRDGPRSEAAERSRVRAARGVGAGRAAGSTRGGVGPRRNAGSRSRLLAGAATNSAKHGTDDGSQCAAGGDGCGPRHCGSHDHRQPAACSRVVELVGSRSGSAGANGHDAASKPPRAGTERQLGWVDRPWRGDLRGVDR
ncbi:hypothetical protein PSET11_01064 [Arthrobacter ulcerisalmonis]|uniref:Uncharacterized protein n=1 Tax=Arthrobacter ulcerisalmonis TaxID=2483813 RepID=A0A3P5WML7_9MICC|nr:hypothetical protein PSET11_01064 [Arthrobacter ulcerisalmonis]